MAHQLRHEDYTVGWVCALPVELAAAQQMLDKEHPDLERDATDNDQNLYALGSIGGHNVAIVCLPAGLIGNNPAATVGTQMRATFKNIRFGLIVGIGGGVPSIWADIRLGDVVVSQPHGKFAGVVQYDRGKSTPSGFERTGSLNSPLPILLAAVARVGANAMRGKSQLYRHISKLEDVAKFQRNNAGPDVLFEAVYDHEGSPETCDGCDASRHKIRQPRIHGEEVVVHCGTIASGNQVMRSAAERDRVSAELGEVLCFEMEAAGLMNSFPCLVIRGICDYADSHKNKSWQPYAAGTAAAYAKEILSVLPAKDVARICPADVAIRSTHKHEAERPLSPAAKRRKADDSRPLEIDTANEVKNPCTSTLQSEQAIQPPAQLSPLNQECLRSLCFPEQEYRFHDIQVAVNTCEWIFDDDAGYDAWTIGNSKLFWVKGDPGTGKSMLMKHMVKRKRERSPSDLVISFFFHGQGNSLQKSLLGLFRALLAQMLECFPDHLAQLAIKFAEKEKRYGGFTGRTWQWTESELQELLTSVLIKGTNCQPIVIFIDALDECGEEPAKSLLAYFKDLACQAESGEARFKICFSSRHYPILALDTIPSIQVEKMNGKDIRWYVHKQLSDIEPKSKRRQIEGEILSIAKGGFQWVFLQTKRMVDGNLTGIKAEELLEELANCPKTLSQMYEAILKGVPAADRDQMTKIFQWVMFAERPLSVQELRDALATSKDMTHTSVSHLRAYGGWSDTLAGFERHVKHISRGLVRFQAREMWEQYDPNGEDSDREAQLIHQSVADFLTHESVNIFGHQLPTGQSLAGSSHLQISRSCLRYMNLKDILDSARLPRNTLSSRFPLAPYAVRFLFEHIMEVEHEGILQSDLISVMGWAPECETMHKLAALWRTLDPDCVHTPFGWPFVGATALHVLVAFGATSAVHRLLGPGCDESKSRDKDGNTPLMIAISEGHQDIALTLLERLVKSENRHDQHEVDRSANASMPCATDLNAKNNDGDTVLDFALEHDMGEIVLKLVEAGVNLEYLGRESALVAYAVSRRNSELLSILIEKGINLDGAIFFALKQRPLRDVDVEGIVFQLLSAGANTARSPQLNAVPQPEELDDLEDEDSGLYDNDALSLACRRDLPNVVEMLLEHGVSPTLLNDIGDCPLVIATGTSNESIVRKLLQRAPSSVETETADGDTALSISFDSEAYDITELLLEEATFSTSNESLKLMFEECIHAGATEFVEIILRRQLLSFKPVNQQDLTHLSLAVRKGHFLVVKMLLGIPEVDVNVRDEYGRTPLFEAAASGRDLIAKLLLDMPEVDVNTKGPSGTTPLFEAAANGRGSTVMLLLDTDGVDIDLRSSLLASSLFGVKDAYSESMTSLLLAVLSGDERIVKLLLGTGKFDINAQDRNGRTALSWTAANGNEALVNLLLETVETHASFADPDKQLMAMWAAIDDGLAFNPQASNRDHKLEGSDKRTDSTVVCQSYCPSLQGQPALAVVSSSTISQTRNGYMHTCRMCTLVDPDLKDHTGRTPLSWAAENGHKDVVRQLLATQRVDVESRDKYNWTPMRYAAVNRHQAIVQLLRPTNDCISISETFTTLLPAVSTFDVALRSSSLR